LRERVEGPMIVWSLEAGSDVTEATVAPGSPASC
jgi:hypothetical protein